MSDSNYIKNIAVVGAGGNSGSYMTECLIKGGKHVVTAITRGDSQSSLPEGIHHIKKVNYDDPATIVEALKGQDALVITLSVTAPQDLQSKLIEAAAKAGVPWILPNGWGPDTNPEGPSAGCVKDVPIFGFKIHVRNQIKKLGMSYIDVHTGFWYEWSLAIPFAYGIDVGNKKATFFDDGNTKVTTTTWPQVGRAVAAILSLPIKSDSNLHNDSLNKLRNQSVYVSSFTVSQKDMLDSVLRVTNSKLEEWTITKENSKERYDKATAGLANFNRVDFATQMYTRVFFPDDGGNYEKTRGTLNTVLGLPEDNLDEATKRAIKRSQEVQFS